MTPDLVCLWCVCRFLWGLRSQRLPGPPDAPDNPDGGDGCDDDGCDGDGCDGDVYGSDVVMTLFLILWFNIKVKPGKLLCARCERCSRA